MYKPAGGGMHAYPKTFDCIKGRPGTGVEQTQFESALGKHLEDFLKVCSCIIGLKKANFVAKLGRHV